MKKRICVLTTAHEALDVRIFYKECRSLAQAGYEVFLAAGHTKPETIDGVSIIPLGTKECRSYRFFVKGWMALWKAIRLKADIYHFHDPDLIPVGLILKLLGRKVIYDVHEDVPKDILSKEWIGSLAVRKIVSFLLNIILKFSTLFFDRIIAATPAISKKFPDKKTIVLRNVPNVSMIYDIKPETIIKTRPSVIYAGGLTKIRGIKEIIEAVGILDGLVELWLAGRWENADYERECKSLYGWRYVEYSGVTSLEKAYSIMKRADIGIVNFLAVPNSVESLPNKAFEYLACKLPVIMSEFTYWKELFGKCAVFVNPVDPKDISEKIRCIVTDRELRSDLIMEGRALIGSEYSWEAESRKLIELYQSLFDGGIK
jgi:glycosyltransferase involved in cell wall biosynthesis